MTKELETRLDNLTSRIASPDYFYHALRPVTDEATKMGAFHSSGHVRGLFKGAYEELHTIGSAIASGFDDIVAAVYEPSRDKEIGALETHALDRFETVAAVLRSILDGALKNVSATGDWKSLDEFAKKSESVREELKARIRTRLESARNDEKKAVRARRSAWNYSLSTLVLSAFITIILTIGLQECYKSKQEKRAKTNEQRFTVRLEVQRALGPPLEAVSGYLQILSASRVEDVPRTQDLLRRNLRQLDAQIPLQTPRIAFAYDSATVDSVFAVLDAFKTFYEHLDSLKTNRDSVSRMLGRAGEVSARGTSLLLRLGSYEN